MLQGLLNIDSRRGRTKDATTVLRFKHKISVFCNWCMDANTGKLCVSVYTHRGGLMKVRRLLNTSWQMGGDSAAVLTQSEWGWTQCCGCGPRCQESSCSVAYTQNCSLWSQQGARRRKSKGRDETKTASEEVQEKKNKDEKKELRWKHTTSWWKTSRKWHNLVF